VTWIRRVVDWCRDIQRRYSAIGGQTLAAGVTLYGFLALFALLVLSVAVLGFLSINNVDLAADISGDLGLTGDAAKIVTDAVDAAQKSRQLTTVVGVVGIIWLGSSWALSIANAYNASWHVPGRGLIDRGRGLVWLLGYLAILGASGVATAGWDLLPTWFAPLVIATSLAANTALWLWTSWWLPNRPVAWRVILGPAILGAFALEALKVLGAYVVPRYVERSSELYGTIGVVFAILLWLLIFGRIVVYLGVIEVRRAEHLAPDAAAAD
jgi:membrane protein